MPGRLAVDFGTCNTVVAVWDEARQEGMPLRIPDLSRVVHYGPKDAPQSSIWLTPSVIHYASSNERWLGQQVVDHGLYDSRQTFRWMKRYIATRNSARIQVSGKGISYFEAGKAFLSSVLLFAAAQIGFDDEEIAFTVPVDAFEHYEDWLASVADEVGMRRYRLIDEPSAAALGYGLHIQPKDVYLVFDFGGGTLDVSVVLMDESDVASSGRRCRPLGKAAADIGGMTIDQWLYKAVLERNGKTEADEEARSLSRALLVECEAAKERLSSEHRAEVSVMNPDTGSLIAAEFGRDDFERVLDEHDFHATIDQTIRRALRAAGERGYSDEHVTAVLMVGGCSLIPAVQSTIRRIFGRERVHLARPLDAIARGAAAFVAGVDFYDHIQHDYAVRYVDPHTGSYKYHGVVSRGTPYPTSGPIKRVTVKATHDEQVQLGLAVFEISDRGQRRSSQPVEIVFDPSGAARMVEVSDEEEERRTYFWMNERRPTFLTADPPAKKGEARFEVEFNVDGNKRLTATAKDLRTGKAVMRDYPLVKLT